MLMLIFSCITATFARSTLTVNAASTDVKAGDAWYSVLSESAGTAQYKKPAKKGMETAVIPDTVKIGNKTYKVTQVAGSAFKNSKSLKDVTIGGNITKIGKRAFYGCRNLRSVTVKTAKLSKKSIGKDAFKGLHAGASASVPADKLIFYRSLLWDAGFSKSGQGMKGVVDTSSSLFDPERCSFEIYSGSGTGTQYTAGDTITFRSRAAFEPALYGRWEEDSRMLVQGFNRCANCGQCFSDYAFAAHDALELVPGGCWCNYFLGHGDGEKGPTTWAFVPDKTPCSVSFQYTIPKGLAYKEGSVRVAETVDNQDLTGSCRVSVSGNCITVTIDDVKKPPFYYPFHYEEYKEDLYCSPGGYTETIRPVLVTFGAEVLESAGPEMAVSAETGYSYKGAQHTESFSATIRTASLHLSNTDAEGASLAGAEFDLYKMKTAYMEGTNLGTSDWALIASGLHAGDAVGALGTGFDRFGNEYKLVQTKAPEGYQAAYPLEFEIDISEDGTVTAHDEDGNRLDVVDGVIQVCVVNTARESGVKAAESAGESGKNTGKTEEAGSVDKPSGEEQTKTSVPAPSSGKKRVAARATYYKDGVRDLSMTFDQIVESSVTVIDAKEISSRAYMYKGYKLEKITLNGEEVDSLPKKVEDGSEIGYYYVTEG